MRGQNMQKLAQNIKKFWAQHGYDVHVDVVKEPFVRGVNTPGHGLRTNLWNGLPAITKNNPAERRKCLQKILTHNTLP